MALNANVIELNNNKYAICILIQSHKSLQEVKEQIDTTLSNLEIEGPVLLDTLFHSGNVEDRFIEINVSDNEFDLSKIQPVNIDKQDEIRVRIAEELKNNSELLENSVLTSVQKRLISRGIGI